MCDGDKACNKCRSRTARVIETNKATVKTFDGRKVVVVPVVMAKGDVVMNGGLLPPDEYDPLAWAGIPVTVGHPEVNGSFASARVPEIHEEWVVGTLYNVQVVDNSLRAEAYIDIAKADKVHKDLVKLLVKGAAVDVSTGYYCDVEAETGEVNGRQYHEVQRDIVPDHLALLPNQDGACSWEDGCGVRSNQEKLRMKARQALKVITNALAAADKKKPAANIVDEIIANANSPYDEEDRESLSKMSANTLNKIAAQFASNEEDEEPDEDDAIGNEDEEDKEEDMKDQGKKNAQQSAPVITDEDREALAFARNHAADHRRGLVAKIVGNSSLKEEELKGFSLSQLELMANGLKSVSYEGRAAANAGETDELADSMMSTGVLNALRKKKETA